MLSGEVFDELELCVALFKHTDSLLKQQVLLVQSMVRIACLPK